MSEPRLISPMLDGFALGGSISDHSGVNCYPAMRHDSDERYIVKTISIPASQVQLDALLLTGAYKTAEDAKVYFQERTRDIRDEVEILNKLSAQRGFLPYDRYQIVPMEEGVGYQVYLISPYQRTLERFLKSSPMTHLAAVNMGIDLCAALAICRENGYLYVDLKPGNIFLSGEQEFFIGDLGFQSLDSLKYASLPDRCRSVYIPPEIADAYAQLNTTMDTYALGLTLYQVYNNGQLPFQSEQERAALMERMAKGESMPAPAYADYEMAQIILKACAYDPADRWQDPNEMGHALIAYMQRNDVNDVPITPPAVEMPEEESEEESEEPQEETSVSQEEAEAAEDAADTETEPEADWIDRMDAILSEDGGEDAQSDADPQPSLRELLRVDQEDAESVTTDELSDDTAGILSLAQELIDHEAPEPAVAPEPIEIPMPTPIVLEDEEIEIHIPSATDIPTDVPDEEDEEDDEFDEEEDRPRKNWGSILKKFFLTVFLLALLAALVYGGYYGYNNYYLQTIDDFRVDGQADQMTVYVDTDMDESLLTVVCKDQHGTAQTSPVEDGTAVFSELTPGSQYLVSLEVSGFHKLVGQTGTLTFSTPERTQIMNFTAVTGPEDGSAVLNFGVEGPEGEEWILHYVTEGEEEKAMPFSGHTVTVTNLTVSKTYTFSLTSSKDIYLIGENSMTFTASNVIAAQDLTVVGSQDGTITVAWKAPEGEQVSGWTVRCYNESGFDTRQEVTETTASFTGLDSSTAYTIEVTAAGMTRNTPLYISANPITVTDVTVTATADQIDVSWEYEGNAPEGGWLVLYTVDNGSEQQVIKTEEPFAVIAPVAPGSHYDISIQSASASSVFSGTGSAEIPAITESFSAYGVTASNVQVTMYDAPDGDWTRRDLGQAATTFAPGSDMALVYYTRSRYNIVYTEIPTLFVIRDSEGKLAGISTSVRTWEAMWEGGYCEETIDTLPSVPGEYTLQIYIQGQLLAQKDFIIS